MAGVTIALTKATTTTSGGISTFNFTTKAGASNASASSATLTADVATAVTDNGAVSTALTAINALTGFTALTGATAAMATAVAAQATVATDLTTLGTDATAIASSVGADVMLSFDSTKVTTVSQLTRALEAILRQAKGGLGGLTP